MPETILKKKKTTPKKVVKTGKEFKNLGEIIADEKFNEYFFPTVKKMLNPIAPPKGMKYKSTPWISLAASGIIDEFRVMDEFVLINQKRSSLPFAQRKYIVEIVQSVCQQVFLHYNRQ